MADGYQYRVRTDQGDFMVTLDQPPESAEQLRSLVESRLSGGQRMTPLPPPIGSGLPQPSQQLGPVGGEELTKHMVAATREPGVMGVIRDPMVNLFAAGVLPGAGAATIGRLGTSAAARIAGEAIGSMGGEAANQLLGVTPPSPTGLGVAGAAPPATRGLVGAARVIRNLFPGSRAAAEALNQAAASEAQYVAGRLAPAGGPSAAQLFQVARAQNVAIPAKRTMQALDEVIGELRSMSPGAEDLTRPLLSHAQGLKTKLQGQTQTITSPIVGPSGQPITRTQTIKSGGTMNPDEIQTELSAISDRVATLKRSGQNNAARLGAKISDAILDDLDAAATTANPAQPATQILQIARQRFLREKTVDELQAIMESATKLKRGQDVGQFNANQALDALKRNRFYTKAFTAAEQAEVEKVLGLLNKVPVLPPPSGATFGSGQFWQKVGQTAAGAGLGAATGMGTKAGAIAGATLGAGLPIVSGLARNIGLALQTHEGRQLLSRLLVGGRGELTPRAAAVLGAYAATVAGSGLRGE